MSLPAGDTVLPSSTTAISAFPVSADNTGVGTGPGPLRHPRPLTAADLHLQLEQEQEAVVNRLTRELSLLRQQSASAASNTSSTSTDVADLPDPSSSHLLVGSSHPTSSRRHRSSSNLSTRSLVATTTMSGIIPTRENNQHLPGQIRDSLSRRSSAASTPSLALSPSLNSSDHVFSARSQRQPSSSHFTHPSLPHTSPQIGHPIEARSPTRPSAIFTARYEEAAYHRSELEAAKQENEALRRRIRDLERSLSSRRGSEPSRQNSMPIAETSTDTSTVRSPTGTHLEQGPGSSKN
ncbi:hypothetical protein MMC19_004027 [Ptychographa xylographoides]|nr:hypothetical protein [Ptychographa xylographoides]